MLDKETEELSLHRQHLPESIEDIRAFAYDSFRITFIFSGGDPNKLILFNKEQHKFETVADDVVEVTSMDTGKIDI